MSITNHRGYDEFFCDFHGDVIPDELSTSNDTGTITTNVALSGNKAGFASILRMDNSNDGDNEMCEVSLGANYFRAQDGHMFMEALVAFERTTMAATVGFTDEYNESGNTLPIELSTTTFASNASTFVGFVIDSDATNDNWHAFWVDDDSDTSVPIATLNTGIPLAADTWYLLRIDVWDAGSGSQAIAEFFIEDENGKSWQYRNASTIDRDAALVPHIGIENRTTTGAYIDIDYIHAGKSRGIT